MAAAGRRRDAVVATPRGAHRRGGIDAVDVRRVPRVSIRPTGTELRSTGTEAGSDQVYDCLGHALAAFVTERGRGALRFEAAPDAVSVVSASVENALSETDLVIVVGGASVGNYDAAKRSLARLGLGIDVASVAIRPGKPTWFGRIGGEPILGLPAIRPPRSCATIFLGSSKPGCWTCRAAAVRA